MSKHSNVPFIRSLVDNPALSTTAIHLRALVQTKAKLAGVEAATICTDVLVAARSEAVRINARSLPLSHDGLLRVKAMLELICYCYVKGIFDSRQIEQRLSLDASFLETFGQNPPTELAIRAFRRRFRTAILKTIEQALNSFRRRQSDGPSGAGLATVVSPVQDGEPTLMEAEHLLDMANIMDQLNAEE